MYVNDPHASDLTNAIGLLLSEQRRTGGWHPDDDPADQVDARTGRPTFTPGEVARLVPALGLIRAHGIDPSTVIMAAFPLGLEPAPLIAVTLDQCPHTFHAVRLGRPWNGWEEPRFHEAEADRVREYFAEGTESGEIDPDTLSEQRDPDGHVYFPGCTFMLAD